MSDETKKRNSIDMLSGPIWNKLIIFALPIVASSSLQQLFNSADVAIAGKFAGPTALAAVGSTGALINLIINLFVGCSTGANVVISRYIARGEEQNSRDAVSTSLVFAVISGVALAFLGFFLSRPLLTLMGSPAEVIEHSTIYMQIFFIGMPFLMLYNFGSAALRSIGDTRRPLIALAFSGVVNVVLNIIFVVVFHMGVAGVAIATVCSEALSVIFILSFLIREEGLIKFDVKHIVFVPSHLKKIVSVGLPAGLQGVVFSLSNVCIQSSVNSFGSAAMAGNAAAANFDCFSYFICTSFVQSAITFASQNFAVGNVDRIKRVYHDALVLSVLSMLTYDVIVYSFKFPLLTIFTDDPVVKEYAVIKLAIAQLPHALICFYEITAAILRAMGKSMLPAILCIVGTCFVRLAWVFIAFPKFKDFGLLISVYPISWIITSAMMITAYNTQKKKLFKVALENKTA